MQFSTLLGKTLVHVAMTGDDDVILFETSDGERYRLYHRQSCCENVRVDDIAGDLDGLLGEPLVMAEEVTQEEPNSESNGYYSESVDFERL